MVATVRSATGAEVLDRDRVATLLASRACTRASAARSPRGRGGDGNEEGRARQAPHLSPRQLGADHPPTKRVGRAVRRSPAALRRAVTWPQ
jgi:hypothetical protein